jgi:mono/diheme cytochrome c family protein
MKMSTRYLGVISVALIAVLNAGCSAKPDEAAKATGTRKVGTAQFVILTGDGATPGMPAPAAFAGAGCSTCHGDNGEGRAGLATEIRHTPTNYSNWVVRNGRIDAGTGKPTSMIAFPDAMTAALTSISAADLATVQAWLQALPRPTSPANMYNDFCANCHGTEHTGGSTNVSLVGVTAAEVRMNVRTGVGTDPSQRDAYMPAFAETDVTTPELEQIITYIGAK